jgi:hypothetical protein
VNTNTGIMLNLVTNDTQKIVDAAMFFHNGEFYVQKTHQLAFLGVVG